MSAPEPITTEIQKLAPTAIIELFEIDATSLGGDVLRFHAGTNALSQNVVWQGDTYVRFPIQVTGFEFNGQGQLPRPTLRVANLYSTITQVLLQYNDLLGVKVTRKRTFAKFLDAVNFTGGVNANADPTAEFDDDVYFVDRKSNEDRDFVEFELAASIDLVGVQIPRRQIIQNICVWAYRGTECGYTGAPLWDQNDEEITSATTTEGQDVITTRAAYLAAANTLNLAEAALVSAASSMGPACDIVLAETQYSYTAGLTATYAVRRMADGSLTAYWNFAVVSLGVTYRQGRYRATYHLVVNASGAIQPVQFWEIERWAVDSAGCSSATTAFTSALSARDIAQTAADTALSNFDTALAALPTNDPLYSRERCGKRLTSCKLRFGENEELPFGSFPAAGLIK